MSADSLRKIFLFFFKTHKHKIVESDSLVPKDDPTVLFTPAGMNQFKREFLGSGSGLRRVATAQRCLRTDDLDKVGKTPGHHTFFEMLGNFSFGDYFKQGAIAYAWEFLTQELKIKKERLWVTVYKDDTEAYKIWKEKIKIPQDRIIKLTDKENFWPAEAKTKGPNGPCGPCSEIFFDQGSDRGCKRPDCNPACNCGRFVEVWNLVFTQFNRKEGGILEDLPKKNIDTGMGLERLAAVMQGVYSNFETDLFRPLVKEIELNVQEEKLSHKELIYAVADHIRAIVFAIYDGVIPSNEARGYVIRKLIRKSTYNLMTLGIRKPFLYKLVPILSEIMSLPYPELQKRRENIAELILAEEKNFISILNASSSILKEKFSNHSLISDPTKSADLTFELYDTYGLPLELTMDWLKENFNVGVSQERLNQKIEEQKIRSKLQSEMKGDVFAIKDLYAHLKETDFLGYKEFQSKSKILKIMQENQELNSINKGDEAWMVLDKTCFYPESGGQVADTGELIKGKNIFAVLDTQRAGKAIIHIGKVIAGNFKKGDAILAKIDLERRLSTARNHTATHLLQAALRKVLGLHIKQQGSKVCPERLRFDFNHFKDIGRDELNRIEEIVNGYIMNNYCLLTKEMSIKEAKRQDAIALFGEKYADRVRVISIGDISKEVCGGTHLTYTGQIGLFKIVKASSVASGVRRIEAVTGTFAYKMLKEEEGFIADISSQLGVPQDKISQELQKRLSHLKELEKQLEVHKVDIVKDSLDTLIKEAYQINNIKLITREFAGSDMDLLRRTVDMIKEKTKSAIIALGSTHQDRALLVMGVTEDLCLKGLDAKELIKDIAGEIGGSGGGRPDFAQAGGSRPQNLSMCFEKLKSIIRDKL